MFSPKVKELVDSLGIRVRTVSEFEVIAGETYPWTAAGLYSPPFDIIACAEESDYTLLHEIIHWSGHPSRLDREVVGKLSQASRTDIIRKIVSFEDITNEEAIANLGMFLLAKHLGLNLKDAHYEKTSRLMYMHYDNEFCERQADKAVEFILNQVSQSQVA
jgi:antirestriction protein ArdC